MPEIALRIQKMLKKGKIKITICRIWQRLNQILYPESHIFIRS